MYEYFEPEEIEEKTELVFRHLLIAQRNESQYRVV